MLCHCLTLGGKKCLHLFLSIHQRRRLLDRQDNRLTLLAEEKHKHKNQKGPRNEMIIECSEDFAEVFLTDGSVVTIYDNGRVDFQQFLANVETIREGE